MWELYFTILDFAFLVADSDFLLLSSLFDDRPVLINSGEMLLFFLLPEDVEGVSVFP